MMSRLQLLARAFIAGGALVTAGAVSATADGPAAARADVIGAVERYTVVADETLLQVAREKGLGYVELMAANPGVDPWLPGIGTEVVVPAMHVLPDAPRKGIVINLTEMRLYLFSPEGEVAGTWPIGIGREGGMTPVGSTRVVDKRADPSWYPPDSIRQERPELPDVVPPGPDNPLGDRAVYLGWPRYLIHGTNKPYGVGRRVSHGCIRLYPEDIRKLYERVAVGTPVTVVDQPIKLGWRDGTLYLQVHPTKTQADQIEADGRFAPEPVAGLEELVVTAAGDRVAAVDWAAVARAASARTGVPVVVVPGVSGGGPDASPAAGWTGEAYGQPETPAPPAAIDGARSDGDPTFVLPPIH